MAHTGAWFCLALLALSGAAWAEDSQDADEYADTYRAHVLVHKSVWAGKQGEGASATTYPLIVQGRNATITLSLHNIGAGPAADVVLTDVLPANAQLLDGSLTATFPKIASGSSVKHSYSVVFTSGGSLDVTFLPSAAVTYKADDETEQVGSSSRAGVFVVTPIQQITRYALIAGTYASLGICRTPYEWRNMGIFLGLIGSVLGVNWSMKAMGTRSTSSKRQKALKELEKDE